jgi:hypothetical protein
MQLVKAWKRDSDGFYYSDEEPYVSGAQPRMEGADESDL